MSCNSPGVQRWDTTDLELTIEFKYQTMFDTAIRLIGLQS